MINLDLGVCCLTVRGIVWIKRKVGLVGWDGSFIRVFIGIWGFIFGICGWDFSIVTPFSPS
jgi:hypothetical protein